MRLPEPLVAEIEAESRVRKVSKSDVEERLQLAGGLAGQQAGPLDSVADLIGSVDGLPT